MNKSDPVDEIQTGIDAAEELRRELVLVEHELIIALEELRSPFSQLVQSELRRSYPLVRGAVVLTAGVGDPDSRALQTQRVNLAAALEVLQLALRIHTRLLKTREGQQETDQSILGSTILAGDFCFSRAAGLAVKTGNAMVVDIFAQALQRMSENHLRYSFGSNGDALDENRELFHSGILGARALTGGAPEIQSVDLLLGQRLAASLRNGSLEQFVLEDPEVRLLHPHQLARWQALLVWLRNYASSSL